MHDKIKLFMESELIISTNSGCLTLCLFANIKSKIIEIFNGKNINHYKEICTTLGLNYSRYNATNEDYNGNCTIDLVNFDNFLNNFI
jgi:capsular polysaccharide biosynthesis protein